jgi:predicted transcriptional regulator
MNKRGPRNRLAIIYDILFCCTRKALIVSEIIQKANVSSDYLYFVEELVKADFLVKRNVKGHNIFSTSQAGYVFLVKYNALLATDNSKYPILRELAYLKSHVL